MVVRQKVYEIVKRFVIAIILLLAILFSVGMVVLSVEIRSSQEKVTDCTERGGACFDRQVANTRNIYEICSAMKLKCILPGDE